MEIEFECTLKPQSIYIRYTLFDILQKKKKNPNQRMNKNSTFFVFTKTLVLLYP